MLAVLAVLLSQEGRAVSVSCISCIGCISCISRISCITLAGGESRFGRMNGWMLAVLAVLLSQEGRAVSVSCISCIGCIGCSTLAGGCISCISCITLAGVQRRLVRTDHGHCDIATLRHCDTATLRHCDSIYESLPLSVHMLVMSSSIGVTCAPFLRI